MIETIKETMTKGRSVNFKTVGLYLFVTVTTENGLPEQETLPADSDEKEIVRTIKKINTKLNRR